MSLSISNLRLGLGSQRLLGVSVRINIVATVPSNSDGAPLLADVTALSGWPASTTITTEQTFSMSVGGLGSVMVTLGTDGELTESDDWSSLLVAGLVGDTYVAMSELITLVQDGEEIQARISFDVSGQTETAIELDFKDELAALSVGAIPSGTDFTATTSTGTRPWEALTGNVSRIATTTIGEIVTVDVGALGEAMIGWADFPGTQRIFDVGTTGTAIRLRSYLSGVLDQTFTVDVADWVDAGDKFFQVVLGVSTDGSTLLAQITNSQDVTRYGTWSLWPLGAELVTNGTFDTDVSGWSDTNADTTAVWEDGKIKVSHTSAVAGGQIADVTLEIGKEYLVECDVEYIAGDAGSRIAIANSGFSSILANGTTITTEGKSQIFYTATATDVKVYLRVAGEAGTPEVYFDNVSVREITSEDNGLARPRMLTLGTGLGSATEVTAILSVNGLSTRTTNAFNALTGALYTPFGDDPARPEVLKIEIQRGFAGHADISNTGLPPATRGPILDSSSLEAAIGTPYEGDVVTVDLDTYVTEDSNDPVASISVVSGTLVGTDWTVDTSDGGDMTTTVTFTTERGVSTTYDVEFTVYAANAKGFGGNATGGEGLSTYTVSNLNDSGAGSLRQAVLDCAASGGIVEFSTSGEILLTGGVIDVPSNTSIEGSTAPDPGIIIGRSRLRVAGENVIIRDLRPRPGDNASGETGEDRDGVSVGKAGTTVDNVLIENCSVAWAVDEGMATWAAPTNVSFLDCIIAETLDDSIHSEGEHSMGMLIGEYSENITIARCLIVSSRYRNPQILASNGVEVINCVIAGYDVDAISIVDNASGTDAQVTAHVIGNVIIAADYSEDPATRGQIRVDIDDNLLGSGVYISDNGDATIDTEVGTYDGRSLTELFTPSGVTVLSQDEVLDYVIANAGARDSNGDLDKVDQRIINDLIHGTTEIRDEPSTSFAADYEVEAEDMTLTNFVVAANVHASGGDMVQASDGTEQTASMVHDQASGVWNIIVHYFDENDGESNFSVEVGGTEVESWVWDALNVTL